MHRDGNNGNGTGSCPERNGHENMDNTISEVLSFVEENDVMTMAENLIAHVFKKVKNIDIKLPLLRMKYDDAINYYGSDKPDMRFEMKINDITSIILAIIAITICFLFFNIKKPPINKNIFLNCQIFFNVSIIFINIWFYYTFYLYFLYL